MQNRKARCNDIFHTSLQTNCDELSYQNRQLCSQMAFARAEKDHYRQVMAILEEDIRLKNRQNIEQEQKLAAAEAKMKEQAKEIKKLGQTSKMWEELFDEEILEKLKYKSELEQLMAKQNGQEQPEEIAAQQQPGEQPEQVNNIVDEYNQADAIVANDVSLLEALAPSPERYRPRSALSELSAFSNNGFGDDKFRSPEYRPFSVMGDKSGSFSPSSGEENNTSPLRKPLAKGIRPPANHPSDSSLGDSSLSPSPVAQKENNRPIGRNGVLVGPRTPIEKTPASSLVISATPTTSKQLSPPKTPKRPRSVRFRPYVLKKAKYPPGYEPSTSVNF